MTVDCIEMNLLLIQCNEIAPKCIKMYSSTRIFLDFTEMFKFVVFLICSGKVHVGLVILDHPQGCLAVN